MEQWMDGIVFLFLLFFAFFYYSSLIPGRCWLFIFIWLCMGCIDDDRVFGTILLILPERSFSFCCAGFFKKDTIAWRCGVSFIDRYRCRYRELGFCEQIISGELEGEWTTRTSVSVVSRKELYL